MSVENFNSLENENKREELLNPITLEKPCGEYLRRHELVIKLKDLRSKLLAGNDESGIWVKKNKDLPKWEDVNEICEEILTNYSKDLLVASYYLEAKFHTNGVAGLASSMLLLLQFCQKYWDRI